MPRYHLELEYDGTPFVGWQKQPESCSVQGLVEKAGAALSGAPAPAIAAGRTDAGVHALAMAVHIDLAKEFDEDTVRDGLNAHMRPYPVAVRAAMRVSEAFHARFSCLERSYLYRLVSRRAPPVLRQNRVWHVPYPIDVAAMQRAAEFLIGQHDFTTFRSVQCQAQSPVKTLSTAAVTMVDDEIHFHFSARSFLHNQIRSFVGTLERVGCGRWQPAQVQDALKAADRAACGPVAPPYGLYFVKARYEDGQAII